MASSSANPQIEEIGGKNIDDLPDELLTHIFSMLPPESTVACEEVSERWAALARDPYVWSRKQMLYSGKQGRLDSSDKALTIITTHNYLIRHLKLQYLYAYPVLKSILSACRVSNLITIELVMCRVALDYQENLVRWTKLRKINMKNSIASFKNEEYTLSYDHFKDLRHLELSEFGLTHLNCGSLINLKYLSHICIDKISDLHLSFIVELIMSKADILETFHFYGGTHVNDRVMKMLSECPKLRSLSVKFCEGLSDAGLISLTNLKSIKQLKIWNNRTFSEACLLKVVGHPAMFQLRLLSFSRILNITSAIKEIICNHYKCLKCLALYQCPRIVATSEIERRLREKFEYIEVIFE